MFYRTDLLNTWLEFCILIKYPDNCYCYTENTYRLAITHLKGAEIDRFLSIRMRTAFEQYCEDVRIHVYKN